jgi:hypothetical protein
MNTNYSLPKTTPLFTGNNNKQKEKETEPERLYPDFNDEAGWKDYFKRQDPKPKITNKIKLRDLKPADYLADSDDEKEEDEIKPADNSSRPESSRSNARIGEEVPRGQFNSYTDYKWERLKSRFYKAQIIAMAGFGIAAIAFPPLLGAAAGLGGAFNPYTFKALGYVFSVCTGLAGNRVALTDFKAKISSAADKLQRYTAGLKDRYKDVPEFKPHLVFLKKLSKSLSVFARKIQDQNLEQCLAESLAFEKQTSDTMMDFLKNTTTETKKKDIYAVQTFLRKYDKYLTGLPEQLDDMSELDRLRLDDLVKKARESNVPELIEWSRDPENLAYNLARLKTGNQNLVG